MGCEGKQLLVILLNRRAYGHTLSVLLVHVSWSYGRGQRSLCGVHDGHSGRLLFRMAEQQHGRNMGLYQSDLDAYSQPRCLSEILKNKCYTLPFIIT